MERKVIKFALLTFISCCLIAFIAILLNKNTLFNKVEMNAENRLAITYGELNDDEIKVSNCEYVEFSAFFTRDLNNDGYAEKIKGTCKNINESDTLYMDLNVLANGRLENGEIIVNNNNFTLNTSLISDSIILGDYLGETNNIKLNPNISGGSQKLIMGTVKSKINNNINNFSQTNSVTLKGTFITNDDTRIEINETREFKIDWYGDNETIVNKIYYNGSAFASYDKQKLDINEAITESSVELTFYVAISELKDQVPLEKQVVEIKVPRLNGSKPIDALSLDKNVEYEYDEENEKLIITRKSEVDENGNIISSISRSNVNKVKLVYPLEEYEKNPTRAILLNIPIVGYNYSYNNTNTEFEDLVVSSSEGVIAVTYSEANGTLWNIYTPVGSLERTRYDNVYRYYHKVSKEPVSDIYNGNIYNDTDRIYPVCWEVIIGDYELIKNITVESVVENGEYKADQFLDSSGNYISMYDYTKIIGVYFENATETLGRDGWIKLYNSETGALLETFTERNWGLYTKTNPYQVDLKFIKVETSNPIATSSFKIIQLKEMNAELIAETFSEEEFNKISNIYSYTIGTIEAQDGFNFGNGISKMRIKSTSYAAYEVPYSDVKLSISPEQMSNQKSEEIEFKISTESISSFNKKWLNGVFLIEFPEDIIGLEIKNISISNGNVEIVSSDIYEENGKNS